MKKIVLSGIVFFTVFAAVYLAQCYLIPGLRIKLSAPPAEYFRESVRHMALLKGSVALAFGLVAAALPWFLKKS